MLILLYDYDDIWLLEWITEKTGIRQDLGVAFGGNEEIVDNTRSVEQLLKGADLIGQRHHVFYFFFCQSGCRDYLFNRQVHFQEISRNGNSLLF